MRRRSSLVNRFPEKVVYHNEPFLCFTVLMVIEFFQPRIHNFNPGFQRLMDGGKFVAVLFACLVLLEAKFHDAE
jgi:hypothetical protein